MPRGAADEVAGRPALAAARTLLGDLTAHRGGEAFEDDGARAGFFCGEVGRFIIFELPAERREVAGLCAEDVAGDAVEVAAAAARTLAQRLACGGVGGPV